MSTPPTISQHQDRIPEWSVHDRLRKARESADLSQTDLARAMGVSPKTVHRAEQEGAPVSRPVVLAWSVSTGVPADWLCPRQDSNLQPTGNRPQLTVVSA